MAQLFNVACVLLLSGFVVVTLSSPGPTKKTVSAGNDLYAVFGRPGFYGSGLSPTTLLPDSGFALVNRQIAGTSSDGTDVGTSSIATNAVQSAAAVPTGAIITVSGHTYTIIEEPSVSNELLVNSQTISAGGSAAVIYGQTLTAVTSGLAFGTATILIVLASSTSLSTEIAAVITVGSEAVTVQPSAQLGPSPVLVVGSATLTIGGQAITTSGEVLSAAQAGVAVNGSIVGFYLVTVTVAPAIAMAESTQSVSTTLNFSTASPSPSITSAPSLGSAGTASVFSTLGVVSTSTIMTTTTSGAIQSSGHWTWLLSLWPLVPIALFIFDT